MQLASGAKIIRGKITNLLHTYIQQPIAPRGSLKTQPTKCSRKQHNCLRCTIVDETAYKKGLVIIPDVPITSHSLIPLFDMAVQEYTDTGTGQWSGSTIQNQKKKLWEKHIYLMQLYLPSEKSRTLVGSAARKNHFYNSQMSHR